MENGSCSSAVKFIHSGMPICCGAKCKLILHSMPVPTLWLDVFQKIRSMGYTGVSFYVDWALLEGEPGVYVDSGVFSLDPFIKAAQTAGVYLLAVRIPALIPPPPR